MIVEMITVLGVLAGGSALLRILGLRGWGLPFLGFGTGVALFVGVGFLQVAFGLPTYPVIALVVSATVPLVMWFLLARRGRPVGVSAPAALGVGAAALLLVLLFRVANLVAWSPDSLRYLVTGGLIAGNHFSDATPIQLPKRLLSVPFLHSMAALAGEWYLPAITPLVAIAVLGCLAWFAWSGLGSAVPRRVLIPTIGIGLLLLVTINRFVFHAFYINGHMVFGLFLLMIVGSSWLLREPGSSRRALDVMILVSIPALVVTRAEAPIILILALLPLLLASDASARLKAGILLSTGISTVLWQVRVILASVTQGESIPFSALAMLGFGVALVAGVAVLPWRRLQQWSAVLLWVVIGMLWVVIGMLWVALGVLAIRDRAVLLDSLSATFTNLVRGAGGWGWSVVMLGLATVAAIILLPSPGSRRLSYVLATFAPLSLLLAYLRGIAYRVGDGDSLNRMVIEFVPIVVLVLIVAVGHGSWRWARERSVSAGALASTK